MGFFEKFFHRSPPVISEEAAVLIARQACETRGWAWRGTIRVWSRWGKWVVRTNTQARGVNAEIVIDQQTGTVVNASYIPR
jgi:hypothetical protein